MDEDLRIAKALESIAKSLSVLAGDTKACEEFELSKKCDKGSYTLLDMIKESSLMFILGIVVGCMLFQLGTELLRWLAI